MRVLTPPIIHLTSLLSATALTPSWYYHGIASIYKHFICDQVSNSGYSTTTSSILSCLSETFATFLLCAIKVESFTHGQNTEQDLCHFCPECRKLREDSIPAGKMPPHTHLTLLKRQASVLPLERCSSRWHLYPLLEVFMGVTLMPSQLKYPASPRQENCL